MSDKMPYLKEDEVLVNGKAIVASDGELSNEESSLFENKVNAAP